MDLKEIGWEGVDYIHLEPAQSLVNMVMNFRISQKAENFLTS